MTPDLPVTLDPGSRNATCSDTSVYIFAMPRGRCSSMRMRVYSMCLPHDCSKPQVVYGTVHLYWKLQNDREKRSISGKKQFYRILIVGNLENLAKNW